MRTRRGTLAVLLVGLAVTGWAAEAAAQAAPAKPAAPVTRARTAAEDLQLFSQVFNQIRVNHPDSLDSHRLFMAAIQAMVQATDPHSYVIPAVRLVPGKEEQLRTGKLHPLPVAFYFVGGTPIVSGVAAGTEASRQDILAGDELVAVDGEPVRAESAIELEIQLAGPKGSTVTLAFERRRSDGSYATLTRKVKRERFSEETAVPAAVMLDGTTGYIRITTFVGEKVASDLRSAVERLDKQGMQRLVLDLRQNGGGSVDEAAAVAGEFLPSGAIIYTSEGRRNVSVDTGRVKRSFWRSERPYPLVVMIDDGSASASELVAGALQDHDRAVIVGQPSFGKSLMMRGFPLSDGSVIVLVVGQIRTPCGRVVQREYRSLSSRDYYRASRAERDTIGRPTCKTASGRTLYGGGGIYPDIRVPRDEDPPSWHARVNELELPLTWAGGYVTEKGAALGTLDDFAKAPSLPDAALAEFRTFASSRGVDVPSGAPHDEVLRLLLVRTVAAAKWGSAGLYQAEARLDPAIRNAMAQFGKFSGRP
ncbi:MAG: PDZ domain-containing protein [Gemmatimonadetes bacterium]|nr:PDZ domain-containing protein [Gemmatimonadota bacterium]